MNLWETIIIGKVCITTPEEMTNFVQNHLGPKLEADGKGSVKILGYDQNREHLEEWVDVMYKNEALPNIMMEQPFIGMQVLMRFFPKHLQYAHEKAPDKYLIQSEACVDAEVPKWKDDAWYW